MDKRSTSFLVNASFFSVLWTLIMPNNLSFLTNGIVIPDCIPSNCSRLQNRGSSFKLPSIFTISLFSAAYPATLSPISSFFPITISSLLPAAALTMSFPVSFSNNIMDPPSAPKVSVANFMTRESSWSKSISEPIALLTS